VGFRLASSDDSLAFSSNNVVESPRGGYTLITAIGGLDTLSHAKHNKIIKPTTMFFMTEIKIRFVYEFHYHSIRMTKITNYFPNPACCSPMKCRVETKP
jgi:hypothetical protein